MSDRVIIFNHFFDQRLFEEFVYGARFFNEFTAFDIEFIGLLIQVALVNYANISNIGIVNWLVCVEVPSSSILAYGLFRTFDSIRNSSRI